MNTESDKFHGDSRGQFALIQKQLTDQQQGIDKMNGDSLTVIQDDLKQLAVIRGDLKSQQQMTEKSLEAIRLNVLQQQLNVEKMTIENHQSHQELTIMHTQLNSLDPEELRVILTEIQKYTRTVSELLEKHMSKGRCHSQPSTAEQIDSAPDSQATDDRGSEETPDRPQLEDVPREESSDRDTPRGDDQAADPMLNENQPTDVLDPEPPKTPERESVEIPDDISEGNSDSTMEVTKDTEETEPEEPTKIETEPEEPTKVEPETTIDEPQEVSSEPESTTEEPQEVSSEPEPELKKEEPFIITPGRQRTITLDPMGHKEYTPTWWQTAKMIVGLAGDEDEKKDE
ncbi:MAG: hypothetical protein J3Q66DRAFT_321465 [Benniella sp.]|nr:MAG: hypothetical protein J3Q66DRAFT_321465 [Benniella sp.]